MKHSSLIALALATLGVVTSGCAADPSVDGVTFAMDDPSSLLTRADSARLLVLPAGRWTCLDDGGTEPAVDDDFAVEVPEAAASLELPVGMPRAETTAIVLAEGEYRVLVQARGDEPLSGRRDVLVAQGCTDAKVVGGETRMVRVVLQPVVPEGVCGDGGLDPDELCDDGNTEDGDGCDARCRTEPFVASIGVGDDTSGTQDQPAVAWAPGQRLAVTYRNEPEGRTPDIYLRVLDEEGQPLASPAALAVGLRVDAIAGEQFVPTVAVGAGSALVAFQDVRSALAEGGDARARRIDTSTGAADPPGTMLPRGVSSFLHADFSATQANPTAAADASGNVLVVFENRAASTGLSARLVPAGTGTPDGTDAWPVGRDGSSGRAPALTWTGDGFALAFEADDDVWVQFLDASGMPGPAPVAVLEGAAAEGAQGAPALAALSTPEGVRLLVVWEERGPDGDGDGSTIRARLLDGDGSPLGEAFVLPTDPAGDQLQPSAAALSFERAGTTYHRFIVTWRSGDRLVARLLDEAARPVVYRTQPPSSSELEIARDMRGQGPVAAGGPSDRPMWAAAWSDGADVFVRRLPLP